MLINACGYRLCAFVFVCLCTPFKWFGLLSESVSACLGFGLAIRARGNRRRRICSFYKGFGADSFRDHTLVMCTAIAVVANEGVTLAEQTKGPRAIDHVLGGVFQRK